MPRLVPALRLAPVALAAATAALGACQKATAPAAARELSLVQGDGQVRQAGRRLPIPLVFRAVGSDGRAVKDLPVTVAIELGGGSVDSASVKTDANGEARVRWTLGQSPAQALSATAPGVAPVRAQATALVPNEIVIVQGNNQSARVGAALPAAVVVRVLGAGNVPMDSTAVSLQITSGGGTITPQSLLTNAMGEATVRWTMGPQAGVNTAIVRAGLVDPAILTATATP